MADRYWVGGAGTWNTSSTTNWSASSGGASGASVPTAADNVIFNGSSGTPGTITLTGALACLSFSVLVTGWTFSSTGTIAIYGSFTLTSVTTWSATGTLTFRSTTSGNTITTNGTTLACAVILNGSGGYWTLGSALTISGSSLTLTNGTFDTSSSGNYSFTVSGSTGLVVSGALAKSLIFNASTISLSQMSNNSTGSNLTFNAGTSTITLGAGFTGGNLILLGLTLTFYNVLSGSSCLTFLIAGTLTFNNLTLYAPTTSTLNVAVYNNLTINGTLYSSSAAGATPANRTLITGRVKGTAVTISAAAVSLFDTDFEDITASGTTWTGTRLGNCGGNTNITFPATKTVYYVSASGGNWSASNWSTSSGGSVASTNFPLPHDTAVIDNNSGAAASTISIDRNYAIGTFTTSSRTNTLTLTPTAYNSGGINGGVRFLQDFTTPSAITLAGTTVPFVMSGRGSTQTVTISGTHSNMGLSVNALNTVSMGSNLTSSYTLTLYNGTLDVNAKSLSYAACVIYGAATGSTQVLALGSSTLTLTGTTPWSHSGTTSFTTTGAGTVSLTSASTKTFTATGQTQTYGFTVNQGGAGQLTFASTAGSTFNNLTNSYSATGATTIKFVSASTVTFTQFTATGTSGKVLTIAGATPSSAARIACPKGVVSVDYMSIQDITAQGGALWYAGVNSTNVSNNKGWIFTAPPASAGKNPLLLY